MEEWRDIPGYPGYQISNLGNARSLDRVIYSAGDSRRGSYTRQHKGRILAAKSDAAGYPHCYPFGRIHCVVLLAFVGVCPAGLEVCHCDGNKLNNRLDNLRYGTQSTNEMDKVAHGTSNRGERHGMAKLTRADVICIRRNVSVTAKAYAAAYNVSESCVRRIRNMKTWSWLFADS